MTRLVAFVLFALIPALVAAQATTPTHILSISGRVTIGPDGTVREYVLDSKPAAAVAQLVEKSVKGWHFEPVLDSGKPVIARTNMAIELTATPVGDAFSVTVTDVSFGKPYVSSHTPLPLYPYAAAHEHLNARVLLAIRLDASGKVIAADVVQTSLGATAPNERIAEQWRQKFEHSSVTAVRHWKFDLSEEIAGLKVGATAYLPIEFSMHNTNNQWNTLIPGPRHKIAWLNGDESSPIEASAIRNGEAVALDSRFKLKSDVVGKTL